MGQKTLILRCIRKGPFLALWRGKGPKLYHHTPKQKRGCSTRVSARCHNHTKYQSIKNIPFVEGKKKSPSFEGLFLPEEISEVWDYCPFAFHKVLTLLIFFIRCSAVRATPVAKVIPRTERMCDTWRNDGFRNCGSRFFVSHQN